MIDWSNRNSRHVLWAIATLIVFAFSWWSGRFVLGLDGTSASFAATAATWIFVAFLPAGQGVGPCIPPAANHGIPPNGGQRDLEPARYTSAPWPLAPSLHPTRDDDRPGLARADELGASPGRRKDLDNDDDRNRSTAERGRAAAG